MEVHPIVLLASQVTVFFALYLLGLPGMLHPYARRDRRGYLRFLAIVLTGFLLLAFGTALAGFGTIAWGSWFAALVTVLVLDIHALTGIRQRRRALRTYPEGTGPATITIPDSIPPAGS